MSENYKLNLYPFLAAFFAAIVVYGFELTHFTMSIDEEFMDNFYQTVALGRWGHSFLREYILPEPFAPFFTTILSIIFLSLSASLTARISGLDTFWSCIMSALYISLPQFAYQLEFANQSDTVAIGTFISTMSVYAFMHGGFKLSCRWGVASLLLYSIAMSIYQSFTILPVTLIFICIAYLIHRNRISNKDSLLVVCKFAVVSILATALYVFATAIVQKALGIHGGSYLSDMIKWGKSDFFIVAGNASSSIIDYFKFSTFYGLGIYALSAYAVIAVAAISIIKKQNNWMLIAVMMVMILSPFIMIIALGGNQPPRAMSSLSPAFASAIVLSLMYIGSLSVATVFSLIVVMFGCASSSRLFYSDYMSLQSDILLANRIASSIPIYAPEFNSEKNPVYFYGRKKLDNAWRMKKSDVFGNSFFAWDGGNNKRITAFFYINGIEKFKRVDRSLVEGVRKDAMGMSTWPSEDSIKMVNGVLIIKLGNEPGID